MLSVARLVSFWRCIPMQYNCQKSSNFQGLSHFSRIFGKNDKIPGFFQAGKTVTISPGFPGAVGTLPRIPVDYLFPTLRDSPHQTKMEVSVVAMQKRLKEAFTVARCLTSEEVARQCRYYDRKAGAVALQPGDVVMVRTDGFVGKR